MKLIFFSSGNDLSINLWLKLIIYIKYYMSLSNFDMILKNKINAE
jgi:hypothetical protein